VGEGGCLTRSVRGVVCGMKDQSLAHEINHGKNGLVIPMTTSASSSFNNVLSLVPHSETSLEGTHGEIIKNSMSNDDLPFDKLFDFCSNVFKEWCYSSARIFSLLSSSVLYKSYISREI
jgi:hypothetical protein